MIHFVFPTDPLDARRIDEYFAPQRAQLRDAGFSTSLVPPAAFEGTATIPAIPPDAQVVYRGWMVTGDEYRHFAASVRASGGVPLTSPEAYLFAHHLPNWYSLLEDLTPETVVLPEDADVAAELRRLDWPAFFLKDYVKSLKTTAGSLITSPEDADRVLDDMRRFRGTIEGGICVRRVERFRADSEIRYFVVSRRAFAAGGSSVPAIVSEVAARVEHPFFSVDIAVTEAGELRVVEIGDGQVSDLVGWSVEDFVAVWRQGF